MSDRPQLRNPVVRIIMDDGAEHVVQTRNPDLLEYDWTSTRHRWPKADEAPMIWLSFIAFAAARREGLIPDMTWDAFQKRAWEVSTVDDTDEATSVMDPTNPARGDG